MRIRKIVITGVAGFAAASLAGSPRVTAQQRPAASDFRVAAVPAEKGGQDIFGADGGLLRGRQSLRA